MHEIGILFSTNSWKGGFTTQTKPDDDPASDQLPIPKGITPNQYEDWLNIDKNVTTSCPKNEDDLFQNDVNEIIITEDEEDDEPLTHPPSHKEMLQALAVLENGVQFYAESFDEHYKYKKYIHDMLETSKKQKKIVDFFKIKP